MYIHVYVGVHVRLHANCRRLVADFDVYVYVITVVHMHVFEVTPQTEDTRILGFKQPCRGHALFILMHV